MALLTGTPGDNPETDWKGAFASRLSAQGLAAWDKLCENFTKWFTMLVVGFLFLVFVGWGLNVLGVRALNLLLMFGLLGCVAWLVLYPKHSFIVSVLGTTIGLTTNLPNPNQRNVKEAFLKAWELVTQGVKTLAIVIVVTFMVLILFDLRGKGAETIALMTIGVVWGIFEWAVPATGWKPFKNFIRAILTIGLVVALLSIVFGTRWISITDTTTGAMDKAGNAVQQTVRDSTKVQFTLPAGTGFCDPQTLKVPNGRYTVAYQLPVLPMKAYDEYGHESLANYKIDEGYDAYKVSATIDGKYVGETVDVKNGTVQFGCTRPGYFSHMKQPPQLIKTMSGLLVLK